MKRLVLLIGLAVLMVAAAGCAGTRAHDHGPAGGTYQTYDQVVDRGYELAGD